MSDAFPVTDQTRVRRGAARARYDRATVFSILDEGLVCHVGLVTPDGEPVVLPTAYARVGETLYLHGSAASRMMLAGAGGQLCVTVTLVDGVVLSRSAFHHSMNYRSVVLFGTARSVTSAAEKNAALEALVEHVVPGRTGETRPPSRKELAATTVLALPIEVASAKVRTGPPVEEPQDEALPHWAGVVPLRLTPLGPVADPLVPAGLAAPAYVESYRRPTTHSSSGLSHFS